MKGRSPRCLAGALFVLGLLASPLTARAATRLYVIAIGNNQAPPGADAKVVPPLRYADDDAAAMVSFATQLAARTTLMTVMDVDTRRLYPELLAGAVAPTLAELRRTVAWHRTQIELDRRAGDESVVLFFFSGHGLMPANGAPSLAMLDGPLTRAVLYDEILQSLPARYVHLLIDACHAEAIVRPRGADLPLIAVDPDEASAVLGRTTLARFPNAGAILAASRAKEAHEWDRLQHGVFTYELLSALRGGGDVNLDGSIEYSEVFAFITAANHGVGNPRASLDVRVYPPLINPRAQLIDLRSVTRAQRLDSDGRGPTSLRIEDDLGRSVAAVNTEPGLGFSLRLPSDRGLFLKLSDGREAEIRPGVAEVIPLVDLVWRKPPTRTRGALDSALDHGLFTMPFGPAYYRGFVGGRPELMPVPLITAPGSRPESGSNPSRLGSSGYAFVGAGVLAAVTGVLVVAAVRARHDFDDAPYQRDGAAALDRMHLYRGLAAASCVAAVGAAGLGLYLKLRVAPVIEEGTNDHAFGLALHGRW